MVRKNFYLSKEQDAFLKSLSDLTVSEHIRRAIDEYIEKKKKVRASLSPSRVVKI